MQRRNLSAASDGPRRLVRKIGETLTEVAAMAAEAERFCVMAGADESQALRIGLALDELAANALVHGAMREQAPDISMELRVDDDELSLMVSARGPRFDPREHRPNAENSAYAIGGRGLNIVLAFADKLSYARRDGRNETIVTVAKTGEETFDPEESVRDG